jgi:beta-lactamase regulating signal transducer with metallopeptidase domain
MNLNDLIISCMEWAWHTTLMVLPVMALLLLLGRWHSFPARGRLLLAGLIALRLLLPVVPALPWHPWSMDSAPPVAAISEAFEHSKVAKTVASTYSSAPVKALPEASLPWSSILALVWLSGVLVTSAWVLGSHLRVRALLQKQAQPASEAVRSTLAWSCKRMGLYGEVSVLQIRGLSTMALWGWITPRVLVPHDVTERYSQIEIRGMLLHELSHLRRRDGLWIWLGLAACALHWFNPLAWLCLRRYLADRELECDREALDLLPEMDRRTYGQALLKTLCSPSNYPLTTCAPFSRSTTNPELKQRILMIAQPTTTRWGRLAALLTMPVLALTTLTTSADEKGKGAAEEGKAKTGARDGEGTRTGPRDGEARKAGARDGETKKTGARDGEGTRTGAREGEGRKSSEGEGRKGTEGGRMSEGPSTTTSTGESLVIQVDAEGNVVNSKGDVIAINQVRGRMNELAKQNPTQKVIVRSDPATPEEKVNAVRDALRDVGWKSVTLETATK